MLVVKNLVKKFGNKTILNNISFTAENNTVIGFLGLNGAGKSTTMNIITGFLGSNSGEVLIDGINILDNPLQAKSKIGYLPEKPPLYFDMTIFEYLKFVYDLKGLKLNCREHIQEICELTKIQHIQGRLIKNLSKGYKQRVGIAQALLGFPPLIILDEPMVGLDPTQIVEIRELIRFLGKKHTVILSSHILTEIQEVCDKVIIIKDGQLVADDTTENLIKGGLDTKITIEIEGEQEAVVQALQCISGVKGIDEIRDIGNQIRRFTLLTEGDSMMIRKNIFYEMSKKCFPIYAMSSSCKCLENVFFEMITSSYNDVEMESEGKNNVGNN